MSKKDKSSFENVDKKIKEICTSQDLEHYKNLKKPYQKFKRVHVNSHFVLLFRIEGEVIVFEDYKHHDDAYNLE